MNNRAARKSALRGPAALLLCAGLLAPTAANAGLGDPPPSFPGGVRAKHVFSMTGILSTVPGIVTVVHCTSMEKTRDVTVGVEFFNLFGVSENDIAAGEGVTTVSPGETVSIHSSPTSIYLENDSADIANNISMRSARVLSTSTRLTCGANWMDSEANPAVAARVPVYKKKQRGN
jgi:hypothetical protein